MTLHYNPIENPDVITILASLADGKFYTEKEIAYMSAVQFDFAVEYLEKLYENNIITYEIHRKRKYYKLMNRQVTDFLPAEKGRKIRPLQRPSTVQVLKDARTCYSHLAGELGVSLMEALVKRKIIDKENNEIYLTLYGEAFLADFGLNISRIKETQPLAYACLDFSERSHHLAGPLGKEMTHYFFEQQWIEQEPASRIVKLTNKGKKGFRGVFNMEI